MMVESMVGLGALFALGAGLHVSPYPLKLFRIRQLHRVCVENRWVALTFDDGPGPSLTPKLLDLLEEAGVRASFFLLGRRVLEAPEVVDEIVARGHEVHSHSMNHFNAWKTLPWTSSRDVVQGFRSIEKWKPEGALFRPPNGKLSLASWLTLKRLGNEIAWWTIDSGDTYRNLPHPSLASERLRQAGGGVVLLHDFDREDPRRSDFVIQATSDLLETVKKEGLFPRLLGDILKNRVVTDER